MKTEIDAQNGAQVDRNGQRPRIDANCRDLPEITGAAWEAIREANDPPTLFRHGGIAARLERGDKQEPIIRPVEFNRLRHHLARVAIWIETRQVGENSVERIIVPPKDVVNDVLATPDQPLPVLTRVVEAPVFAPDGTLQTAAGYHPASQTLYAPADGFEVPEVPDAPTGQDVEHARIVLCEELLGDFPFISEAERAHAVAMLLLPFVRDLIQGPTPLHLFEKPSPGTGATLLVDMLAWPMTGRPIPALTEGRDEDEWRKRLTAKFRGATPFLFIDNLRRRLDSAAVASAITSPTWEDRLLGASEMLRIPIRSVWCASGNNPGLSSEMARRTVRIRLDAKIDRPWLRTEFRRPDLRGWAAVNRGLLVWSALTLGRAWLAAGRPMGTASLGMFEGWAAVLGGILANAGVPGFLGNLTDFYDESDVEGANWRTLLLAWWERFGGAPITVAELYPLATADSCISLGDGSEQSQRIILGKMLGERRDRVFDVGSPDEPRRLVVSRGDKVKRATLWSLKLVSV